MNRTAFLQRVIALPLALLTARAAAPHAETLDFERCFDVDADLSRIGIHYATGAWRQRVGSMPTVLWVHVAELSYANDLLTKLRSPLVALVEPRYAADQWSVGTRLSKGFGSLGT